MFDTCALSFFVGKLCQKLCSCHWTKLFQQISSNMSLTSESCCNAKQSANLHASDEKKTVRRMQIGTFPGMSGPLHLSSLALLKSECDDCNSGHGKAAVSHNIRSARHWQCLQGLWKVCMGGRAAGANCLVCLHQ